MTKTPEMKPPKQRIIRPRFSNITPVNQKSNTGSRRRSLGGQMLNALLSSMKRDKPDFTPKRRRSFQKDPDNQITPLRRESIITRSSNSIESDNTSESSSSSCSSVSVTFDTVLNQKDLRFSYQKYFITYLQKLVSRFYLTRL